MQPFNLEKALAGEPVVTRDGNLITQLTRFNLNGYPLRGVLNSDLCSFALNGRYWNGDKDDHAFDLFMSSPITVEGWVNVSPVGFSCVYHTEAAALDAVTLMTVETIHLSRNIEA